MQRAYISAVLGAALVIGCGSTQARVDQNQRVVRVAALGGRDVSYRFGPIPNSWERIRIEGNDVAWHDRVSDAVVHVDHTCERSQDTPLPSLVQHLLIGFTDREFLSEETIPFDEREARHVVVRARLDGVPVMLELFVMKKDGCVFDLGVVAPPDAYAQIAPHFGAFARGFSTLSTGGPRAAAGGASR